MTPFSGKQHGMGFLQHTCVGDLNRYQPHARARGWTNTPILNSYNNLIVIQYFLFDKYD